MKPTSLLLLLALTAAALPTHAQGKVKTKRKGDNPPPVLLPAPVRQAPVPADWSRHYADYVSAERLQQHLSVLASDEYEGRETGEKGQHMAAAYVAEQFRAGGLQGPVEQEGGPYLQQFQLQHVSWAPGATLAVGKQPFQWLADFYGLGDRGFQETTTVQPVFVGYGIEQGGYNDYAGRNVGGKDLLMLLGEPTDAQGRPRLGEGGNPSAWGRDYRLKLALAAEKGARSVFFVDVDPNANFAKLAARLAPTISRPGIAQAGERAEGPAAFFISPAVAYALLSTNAAGAQRYVAQLNAAGKSVPGAFKMQKMSIKAAKQRTPFTTENVLGYVPGTDKKDEVVVISAHHDHLGIRDGVVYPGADDDGSGTATIINLAETFARARAEGHGPRRSLLFLSVTGEEEGLYGSEYYAGHPVFPLKQTVADLNVDMVGRTDEAHTGGADYVYVIGSDKLSSELKKVIETQNRQYTNLELDYRFDDPEDPNRFYYRSDHYNFAVKKIPVAFFFNGVHEDYHQPSDTLEKIQFDKMQARARLVFHAAWEVANRDERLVVDTDKP